MSSSRRILAQDFEPDAPALAAAFVPEPFLPGTAPSFEGVPGASEPAAPAPPPDVDAIRAEAFAAGREAGRAELPVADAEALAAAAKALQSAAHAFTAERRDYVRAQRHTVVELAILTAEHVLGRGFLLDEDDLAFRVERALAHTDDDAAGVQVALAPEDVETLRASHAELVAEVEGDGVELVAEAGLARGDVQVRAGALEVDARTDTLLRRAREALLAACDATDAEEAS